MLGLVSRGTRITAFVGKDITDGMQLVMTSSSVIIVEAGGV